MVEHWLEQWNSDVRWNSGTVIGEYGGVVEQCWWNSDGGKVG